MKCCTWQRIAKRWKQWLCIVPYTARAAYGFAQQKCGMKLSCVTGLRIKDSLLSDNGGCMLREHLIVKTRPYAYASNVIRWGNYRVTVLGTRLFRMERSENGKFRDCATQAIWYRDMPQQNFSVAWGEHKTVIDTGECRLILHENREQVCVELNGKSVRLDNFGNLLGTYRTLDCCDGDIHFKHWIEGDIPYRIELSKGVCSKTGVAIIDDSNSLSFTQDGEVINEKADGSDEYIFAFGDDYRGAVCALYALTGNTPLVPRYALGNWWSRYHVYTDKEYLRVLSAFEEREIPLSVATVDMDWHWSDSAALEKMAAEQGKNSFEYLGNSMWGGHGWTGYSWNTELFPDYRDFLKKIKAKGLKITLNLHPSDGVRFWEDQYEEMKNALALDTTSQYHIPFDFSYSGFINAYFEVLHRPYEEDGVDFWWIDWQQKPIAWYDSEECTYDPLWALNHYHYLDNADGHKTPLLLSRYAGIGSHRYPLGFSGDTFVTWKTLAYLPYFTATASNVGYTWWSHDIGGHHMGEKSDELYLRHVQYGVFSPINRLHCSCYDTMTKEPWLYGNGAGETAVTFLRLRHALIPYLYTASHQTSEQGRALIEPLYYQWKNAQAYNYKEEYLFGSQLLVAPVTSRCFPDGYARVRAWLPEGKWTDIFTGDSYEVKEGGKEITLLRDKDSIPVLIKEGGILPLSMDKGNAYDNPANLEVWSYKGNGEYTLYEDGKEQGNDGVLLTNFVSEYTESEGVCTQALTITADGDASIIPQNRIISVRFKDVPNMQVRLYVDGELTECEEWITCCAGVKIPFEQGKTYRVEVEYKALSVLEKAKLRAKDVLTKVEGDNDVKYRTYCALLKAESMEEYLSIMENSAITAVAKLRLKETL